MVNYSNATYSSSSSSSNQFLFFSCQFRLRQIVTESSLSTMRKEKQGGLSDRLLSLRQRLHDSLSLGLKYNYEQEARWICIDAGIESQTLKRMDAFLDSLSLSISRHTLIQASITKIITALTGILNSHSSASLNYAIEVTSKLVFIIQTSIRDYPTLEMIASLSHLLSLNRFSPTVKSSCLSALSTILTNLSSASGANHRKILDILETNCTVVCISRLLNEMECFTETVILLRTIALGWPALRFRVWKDNNLMTIMRENCDNVNVLISTNVLKVLSSLALCRHGVKRMVENEALFCKIIKCMGKPNPVELRIGSLILLRHIVRFEEVASTVRNANCETIIQAITGAMAISNEVPLILEACRTASVLTSRSGPHHQQLWAHDIDAILVDIISRRGCNEQSLSCNKEIIEVDQHVWDILSFLVAYLPRKFHPKATGEFCRLDDLVTSACSWALKVVGRNRSILSEMVLLDEPISRALLLMLFSPCNFISRKSRAILSSLFEPCYDPLSQFVARALSSLRSIVAGAVPTSQAIIDLNILGCLSAFPQYRTLILERNGLNILFKFIKGRLESDILVGREKFTPHLKKIYVGIKCCSEQIEDWGGADLPLFYALLCFSQSIEVSNYGTQDSMNSLFQNILGADRFGEGPKSYCAYILSLFGFHGFQSDFGRKIAKIFDMEELADMRFTLYDGYSLDVHGAILAARCPKLVPLNVEALSNRKAIVRMSERVNKEALDKIVGYVYSGFTEMNGIDEDCLKKVKVLSSNCGLDSISQMLNKEWPKWGSCGPHFDLTRALGPEGHRFSDVILEAKSSKQLACSYNGCHLSTPHVHTHKVILCASCEYMRALFNSGMNDSFSNIIKVPVGWEALVKLTEFFYRGKIPRVIPDCHWRSLTREEKLSELIAYTELSSLADYWLLEGVAEDSLCFMLPLFSHEVTDEEVIIKVVRFAYGFGEGRVVEMGVKNLAPIYTKLRNSGYIAETGDEVAEMLRVEHIRLL